MKARNVKDQFDNGFTSEPRYPGLQNLSTSLASMECSPGQRNEIRGMIRTLEVNRDAILDCCKDDGKTAVEPASDEMVIGEVRALCQFPLLVSPQNHSDLSITALDDALRRHNKRKGAFREQKMSMYAKATLDG